MNKLTTMALLVAGLVSTWGASGLAATINFDDYPTGTISFADASRYRSVGAIFSRDIPIYSVAAVEAGWWVTKFAAGGGSLPNVMALSPAIDSRRSIDLTFVVPGSSAPATTNFVSALVADTEVGTFIGRFEAFDVNGNLLGSTSPTTPTSSVATISFSMPSIARVRFTDVDDGFETDNIVFNAPVAVVPMPPAWQLMMAGLAVMGIGRRHLFRSSN